MTQALEGRRALISGASRGLGRAMAIALARSGAHVAIGARRPDAAREAADMILQEDGVATVVVMDVASGASVEAAIADTVAAFGGLDIVIHNANNDEGFTVPLCDVTDALWSAQYEVALGGLFRTCKAAYPYLKESGYGRLITVSSTFGFHGAGHTPVYSALKGGMRGLVRSLAREWGRDAITVNAINPAAATEQAAGFFGANPGLKAEYEKKFALGRLGDPLDDVASVVPALCSDAFRYVTAQTIQIDGGLYPAS